MRYVSVLLGGVFCAVTLGSAASLLVLPLGGNADKGDAMVIGHLYRDALQAQYNGTVLSGDSMKACEDRDCALNEARLVNADQVVFSSLYRIGAKGIFTSTILSSSGGESFNQRLTALSIEDMEAITKRMADALLNHKNIEQAATVDNVTENESTRVPERRRSLSSVGVSLGYIYPTQPSNFNNYSAVIRVALESNWELRNDLLLNGELIWGASDASIGADLNLDYLFNRSDYTPFLGGGIGLHYVNSADLSGNARHSGPALNLQGGMLLFRTYDVHVLLRGRYEVIFNDDNAQTFGFDVGFDF